MAGQGRKTFSDGEVLSAADVNGYLMDQSVMRFADSTARTAAIGTPTEGMVSYLDDTNDVEVFDGSGWVNFTGDITSVVAGTALTGGGSEGNVTLDVDTVAVGSAIGIDGKQDNVITTQGDLIIGDASGDPVRLPVGSADQVLTSDGTTVSFQDAGGGGGLYGSLITSGTISGDLVITSLPQTYKDIIFILKGLNPGYGTGIARLNNDSNNAYGWAFESSEGENRNDGGTFMQLSNAAGPDSVLIFTIRNYTDTSSYKAANWYFHGLGNFGNLALTGVGTWDSGFAVNQVGLLNIGTTGTYEVYGVN